MGRDDGGPARVVVADVAEADACAGLVEEAGDIDGLVLNVGIGRGAGLAGTSARDSDTTFAVNLRAHFLVAQAAMPRLAEGAAIVFISSVAGLQPGSRIPVYDASKAGLLGLCRHVALEGAAPGRARRTRRARAHRHAARPARHAGTPGAGAHTGAAWPPGPRGEVASATVFLLSGDAATSPAGARRRRRPHAALNRCWSR